MILRLAVYALLSAIPAAADPPFDGGRSGMSAADAFAVGWVHYGENRPSSSFLGISPRKLPGVTRIGMFGCSFIQGSEAARGRDVATLLGRELRRRGRRVEVINFGTGAWGLHQAYYLWKSVGRRYALDYAVFGVYSWLPERDTSFMFQDAIGIPLHLRYAWSGDRPVLLLPAGKDYDESIRLYARVLRPWRYWRYDDRFPPPFQAAHANPLYYRFGERAADEMKPLYRALLADVAAETKLVVLTEDFFERWVGERLAGIRAASLTELARLGETQPELYRAPQNHPSALANRLRAAELAAFLAGERRLRARLASLRPLEELADRGGRLPPLDAWWDGRLRVAGRTVATLVEPMDPKSPDRMFRPVRLSTSGVHALFIADWAPLRAAGLGRTLDRREPLVLSFRGSGGRREVEVGRVASPTGVVGIPIYRSDFWKPGPGLSRRLRLDALGIDPGRPGEVRLLVGPTPVMRGTPSGDGYVRWEPVGPPFFHFRATASDDVDLQSMPASATADVGAGERRAALAAWRVEPGSDREFRPSIPWPLAPPR